MATKDAHTETKLEVQKKFLYHLPRAVDDWATIVHDSDDPKVKLEFISLASKLTGLEPKNDINAGLAVVNFTINMNGAVTATVEREAVDVEVVEKPSPSMLLPEEPAEVVQPAAPKPALALEILPLDD